jgi:hypothetical protein
LRYIPEKQIKTILATRKGEAMISKVQAIAIVEKLLNRSNTVDNGDLQIDADNIGETDSHWIIGYNSSRYLSTNDSQYALMGNNPYAIMKASGQIDHDYETNIPL